MGNGSSYKAAGLILLLVIGYFGLSAIFRGGSSSEESSETVMPEDFTVLARKISPTQWQQVVTVRGRTKAFKKVTVRSETSGIVAETPAKRGTSVKKGDVLCRLKIDARQSQSAQAKAELAKAQLDLNTASELLKEGLGSKTSMATAKAAMDLAKASFLESQLAIAQTNITAPFDGVFDARMVEVGDFLSIGDPCGIVIQRSPFLVTGGVSEQQIATIQPGDKGIAVLATGEEVEGTVSFVASAADPLTRTFDVELEVPNDSGKLRDGVTAQFKIFASQRSTHLIKRSALVLNDAGQLGVQTINSDDIVKFVPVTLLGESLDGVYVSGLESSNALIVRGQEFVADGQHVSVAYDKLADGSDNSGDDTGSSSPSSSVEPTVNGGK